MQTKPKKDIDLAEVERLASLGLNRAQISSALGISESTFYQRQRENEDFAEAIKRGESQGIALVSSKLMEQVNSGNVTAMIFYLKSRAGWNDKHQLEVDMSKAPIIHFVDDLED